MNTKITCEVCGCEDTSISNEQTSVRVKYGSKEYFTEIQYSCPECKSMIITKESELYREKAIARSKEKATFTILKILEETHSFTNYERILDIEFGTFNKWKTGELKPSDAEYALLVILLENFDSIIFHNMPLEFSLY